VPPRRSSHEAGKWRTTKVVAVGGAQLLDGRERGPARFALEVEELDEGHAAVAIGQHQAVLGDQLAVAGGHVCAVVSTGRERGDRHRDQRGDDETERNLQVLLTSSSEGTSHRR
jgi:hypothetical protein